MSSTKLPDGRWRHTFRQSFLKEFDLCPHKALRSYFEMSPKRDTDAACVGTAVHAAIEACLYEHMDGQALLLSDMLDVFNLEFSHLMSGEFFEWVKYDENSARKFGETCVSHWYEQVLDTLPTEDCWMEQTFNEPLWKDELRTIRMSGTADLVTPTKVIDWKTAGGGPYREWEYKRWAIQPTVYTLAFQRPEFEYVVMHSKGVQRFTLERTEDDHDWLIEKCLAVATYIEAELGRWHKNDTHALCSPVWCPEWSECKGASVGADPWSQIKTKEQV